MNSTKRPYTLFRLTEYEQFSLKQLSIFSNCTFEVKRGWFGILLELGTDLEKYCNEHKIDLPIILQIKEKFGTLRFYYTLKDKTIAEEHKNAIREMVKKAEDLSEITCEKCGEKGELVVDSNFWSTVCPSHRPKKAINATDLKN